MGLGGTALKLYNDVVQRGRKDPITEKDFTTEDLGYLSEIVRDKVAKSGEKSGYIENKDYGGPDNLNKSNILGGFHYTINEDGSIKITDKYDFNLLKRGEDAGSENPILQALATVIVPNHLASYIGRKVVSNKSGKGVPVTINIK